jgi:hypothetical protein
MYVFKINTLILLLALSLARGASNTYIAVFSDQQTLWHISSKTGSGKVPGSRTAKPSVGVLPVNAKDYHESIPCDSCHRLSPQGVRFALENYFLRLMDSLISGGEVRLLAPHHELVSGHKVKLLESVDSLAFPFEKWFDGFNDPLIYRPGDRYTPRELKERLNRLGGTLGLSHLLIPTGLQTNIFPKRSNDHVGKLEFSFYLVFWNVSLAYPEWVLFFREKTKKVDLDDPLKKYLDKGLFKRLQRLPEELKKLMAKEPK